MALYATILFLYTFTALFTVTSAILSGSGNTTRGWDCCKPSCGWEGKANVTNPVTSCDIKNNHLKDYTSPSSCDNGPSYMCADQKPWQIDNTTAYGYATVSITGGNEASWCCACFNLTFTSGHSMGKKMTVQATNSLGDAGFNVFSLAVRGVRGPWYCYSFWLTWLFNRYPVAASAPLIAALNNMGFLQPIGVSSTAVYHPRLTAIYFLKRLGTGVAGALIGLEVPTTQRK